MIHPDSAKIPSSAGNETWACRP